MKLIVQIKKKINNEKTHDYENYIYETNNDLNSNNKINKTTKNKRKNLNKNNSKNNKKKIRRKTIHYKERKINKIENGITIIFL